MPTSRALLLRLPSAPAQQHLRPLSYSLLTLLPYTTPASRRHATSSTRQLCLARPPTFPRPCTRTRAYSQPASTRPEPPDYLNEAELRLFHKIQAELEPVALKVQDVSGGCGSMYALDIESPKFKGLPVIAQHKMVNAILKEEIRGWHGVQLRTKAA